ncbi:hypothetical protein DK842_02910 [Chromobacterium phragmitis]|uniref:Bacteriocin n=1 Tax=Chromobacterium phragmitis TaxID=2202141 RepID=A0A344UGB1_9NEIS|nr:hypothetical protein [Chromobacterium phragmitis]AXE28949.1 hypothetical protein DK842_02910 [Chromobacterium phragmitis]AXE34309.1 hypothetical protein DK843_08395 [Chromobacterium phragmitis]
MKSQTIQTSEWDSQLEQSLEIAQMVRLSSEEIECVSGGQANNGPTTGFVPRKPPVTGFVPQP